MACPGPLSRGIPEGLGLRLGHLQPEEHAPRCLAHAFCAPVICGQRDFSQRAAGDRGQSQCAVLGGASGLRVARAGLSEEAAFVLSPEG